MAKSIDEGFSAFLTWLVPAASEHDKARAHKSSVESCLINGYGCSSFFETGSFGNGTGVRHHSDTDYFAVIPAKNLKEKSSISLREIKESLQVKFWNTAGIVVNCPAVRIPFGTWASEKMEVTPAYFYGMVEYDGKKFAKYEIPDCSSGWMNSSPSAHNYYVQKTDDAKSNKVKLLIRLIKAWKYYWEVPIISFFLEIYVTRHCSNESYIDYAIDLALIFEKLEKDNLPGLYDPVGISGHIKPCSSDAQHAEALSKVKSAAGRARRAINQAHEGKIDDAFLTYDLLFNYNFPAR
ncbi:hypothetical protein HNQ93_004220 [Hymenobacter luteus]|uniref:Nucleotidyltransferase n=2 Tax=Hymenobacter TaxID=89966 RepID=A0A7W9WEC5_9BACT|nr:MULTISPECIES: nucleotidyltransferase [Hymenobacter]MBB4603593.1 hypothetical protein [Hymenobacter latericoloratus]MBB6061341.1 hypothetical protein [Hymenobacter luteus]